jgi:hypothetical protein
MPRLQLQVRHQEGSHLGVGVVPQSPSANATSLTVPNTPTPVRLVKKGLTPLTSAKATSLTVPDTTRLMKGGLTSLTSANAISSTIPDQLQKKHILRQSVTFINSTLITHNPGQRVIIDGRHWILRDRPTISIPTNPESTTTKDQQTQTSPINFSLNLSPISPAESRHSSDGSVATYHKCYIPPEINESKAESVDREKEIQRSIHKRRQERDLLKRLIQLNDRGSVILGYPPISNLSRHT